MRILVVGGGIGGVAAAAALHRAGMTPVVLEQAPELTQVGAGVNISANGMKALVHLGADQHVRNTSVLSEGTQFNDMHTGEVAGRVILGSEGERAWGENYYHCHRADILDSLVSLLPVDTLRLGAAVTSVEDRGNDVVIRLADGTEVVGDAVVGADGLQSKVRTSLFGETTPEPTGYVAWRSLIDASAVDPMLMEPTGRSWLGPHRHIITYPISGRTVLNFVGFVPDGEVASRESWTASGDVTALRKSFSGACHTVDAMVSAIDKAFITNIQFRQPLTKWGAGRVVLLGDAAHPIPPSAAQGACMALEDAVMLGLAVERFGAESIEQAFHEYATRRRPRTARLFGTAMNNFRFFNQSDPLEIHGRNGRFRGLERLDPLSESTWGWIYTYDVVAAIDEPVHQQGLAAAATVNPLVRPAARKAFDLWRNALLPQDFAGGEPGLRAGFDRFLTTTFPPGDSTVVQKTCDDVPALRVAAVGREGGPAVLHLHGGLFTMGSAHSSVEYATRLADAVDGWALVPDYRLAPEHEFPAALDEAFAIYRWLRTHHAGPLLVSGVDAGAGLAVSLALAARDAGIAMPDGLFLVSPLCDLTLSGASITTNASTDPWISRQFLAVQAASYIHGHDPAEPLISPLYGDLTGLPPMIIHAARQEALADDASRLAAAASAAGVEAKLTLVDDTVHGFTLFNELPEASSALAELRQLARGNSPVRR